MDPEKLAALREKIDRRIHHMPGEYLLVQQMPSEPGGGFERVRLASGTQDEMEQIKDRETFGERNLDYEILSNEGADHLARWMPGRLPARDASYPISYE